MTAHGKYNPANPDHLSPLFSYGEVPLSSNKLNLLNGNLEDSLNFFLEAAVALLAGAGGEFLLPGSSPEPLRVIALAPPGMAVHVEPGRCIVSSYFAGIDSRVTVPDPGTIPAPLLLDRIDLVVIDRSGTVSRIEGTEAPVPVPPVPPAHSLTLARIRLRPGMASIKDLDDGTNGYLLDLRPPLLSGRTHRHGSDRFPPEAPDGLCANFSTASRFIAGTLQVYLNGLLQKKGASADYTENGDRRGYTFNSPPQTGDTIQHLYHQEE